MIEWSQDGEEMSIAVPSPCVVLRPLRIVCPNVTLASRTTATTGTTSAPTRKRSLRMSSPSPKSGPKSGSGPRAEPVDPVSARDANPPPLKIPRKTKFPLPPRGRDSLLREGMLHPKNLRITILAPLSKKFSEFRIPGGRVQSEDEEDDHRGDGEPLSPPVSPSLDKSPDGPETFDQVPKTPAGASMPSDIEATEAKRTSEKDAVTMEESLDLIGMICTVTKFHKFSITQILREINLGDFRSA